VTPAGRRYEAAARAFAAACRVCALPLHSSGLASLAAAGRAGAMALTDPADPAADGAEPAEPGEAPAAEGAAALGGTAGVHAALSPALGGMAAWGLAASGAPAELEAAYAAAGGPALQRMLARVAPPEVAMALRAPADAPGGYGDVCRAHAGALARLADALAPQCRPEHAAPLARRTRRCRGARRAAPRRPALVRPPPRAAGAALRRGGARAGTWATSSSGCSRACMPCRACPLLLPLSAPKHLPSPQRLSPSSNPAPHRRADPCGAVARAPARSAQAAAGASRTARRRSGTARTRSTASATTARRCASCARSALLDPQLRLR